MEHEILKAKLTNEGTLEVTLKEINDDDSVNEVVKKCGQLVHEDLRMAFAALKGHLVLICDLREAEGFDIFDPAHQERLGNINVNAFTIGGNDDHRGVCLIGSKKLKSKKIINLVAPFTKFEDDEYPYSGYLVTDVELCVKEVERYLFEGKYMVKQLELPFDEAHDEAGDAPDEYNLSVSGDGVTYKPVNLKKLKAMAADVSDQEDSF